MGTMRRALISEDSKLPASLSNLRQILHLASALPSRAAGILPVKRSSDLNAIASIGSNCSTRPVSGARSLPGEVKKPPLETQGVAGGGTTDVEEMLLKLQEKSFYTEIALRIQVGDMGKQPLARVQITDLALMIISGRSMTEAMAAVKADRQPISTMISAYTRY